MLTKFHEPAVDLAIRVQQVSLQKHAGAPNSLVRDALFVLTHDAVCVHKAIGMLCVAGWSGPGAALLRALIDLNVSTLAIVNSANPPMAAFRYLYSGLRRHSREQSFTSTQRKAIFASIRARIAQLPHTLKGEAMGVIREPDRPYWFSQEFSSPTDVIRRFGAPDMDWGYLQVSAAAHGSFLGLRLFRDLPDEISINPQPPGPKAFSLELSSCRWLLSLLELRNASEQLGLENEINVLVTPVREAGLKLAHLTAS